MPRLHFGRGTALVVCIGVGATICVYSRHDRKVELSKKANTGNAPIPAAPRVIFRFSVIPAGVYSSDELENSRQIDDVIAAHYVDFGRHIQIQQLSTDTQLYVSYRKGLRVFWTTQKRRIPKGEYVVSDGIHLARARCGNRLSAVPQGPTESTGEPSDAALIAPELPSETELGSNTPDPLLFPYPEFQPEERSLLRSIPEMPTPSVGLSSTFRLPGTLIPAVYAPGLQSPAPPTDGSGPELGIQPPPVPVPEPKFGTLLLCTGFVLQASTVFRARVRRRRILGSGVGMPKSATQA